MSERLLEIGAVERFRISGRYVSGLDGLAAVSALVANAGVAAAKLAPATATPIARIITSESSHPIIPKDDLDHLLTEAVNGRICELTDKMCCFSYEWKQNVRKPAKFRSLRRIRYGRQITDLAQKR
jgi:hypothetical protein